MTEEPGTSSDGALPANFLNLEVTVTSNFRQFYLSRSSPSRLQRGRSMELSPGSPGEPSSQALVRGFSVGFVTGFF